MGLEAVCVAHYGESVSEGKALLESDDLCFRGDFRLTIPFTEMRSVAADGGNLEVAFGDGLAVFELGAAAERWADRIQHPPSLLDKLDVTVDARVAILGLTDAGFLAQLRSRTGFVLQHSLAPGLNLIILRANSSTALEQLDALEPFLRRDGAIWVIVPKGRRSISETAVLNAGRAAGYVDTKVASFSTTQTAHKFVIPKERR
jgi:hypothetical protein